MLRRRGPTKRTRTRDELAEFWRAQRSTLRAAVDDSDYPAIISAIEERVTVDLNGCWIWGGRMKGGYPQAALGGRVYQVHRLVLEAKHRTSLGSQAAHHTCAVTACVNPDHLQPVTHRDNVAEMLARRSYLARIRDLEAALSEVAPDHPLLEVIAIA